MPEPLLLLITGMAPAGDCWPVSSHPAWPAGSAHTEPQDIKEGPTDVFCGAFF